MVVLVFPTLRIKELVSLGFGDFRITVSSAKDFDSFNAKELVSEATQFTCNEGRWLENLSKLSILLGL